MSASLALFLALLPGVHAWLLGRRLVGFADDPALPERLQTAQRWMTIVFATITALILVLGYAHSAWAVPLTILSSMAGGFPARRVLYGETGSFAQLLARTLRLWSAIAGFWIVLAFAPLLVRAAIGAEPVAAILLGALLTLWALAEDRVALAILRVAPLDRDDLAQSFAPVLERATIATPELYRLPARGGRWANALAISSRTRPAVVFTEGLLDLLDARETTAILGHEVAHLEHWTPRHLLRRVAIQIALVLAAVLIVPPLGRAAGEWSWIVFAAWPVSLLIGLLVRASRHQAHEAESDRRAVALCGDPEALISALAKLHAAARLPSRWQREAESAASHPSLARRIRTIREAGGAAEPEAPETLVVRSTEPGRFIVLERERIHWLDGVPAGTPEEPHALREAAGSARAVAYRELADLHVRAGLASHAMLTAMDRAGKKWSVPVRREDVVPLQATLDRVDPRLAARATSVWLHPIPGALVGLLVLLGGLIAAPLPASALAALLVIIRTTTPTLAACGVSALATALLLARDGALTLATEPLGLALLAGGGAAALLLALARARKEEAIERRSGIELAVAVLALGTAIMWLLGVAAVGTDVRVGSLNRFARMLPGTITLTLGLAAALACWPRRAAQAAALVVALLALLPAIAASRWFAAHVVADPMFSTAPPLEVTHRFLEPSSVVALDFVGADLRIAPSGEAWAIREPPARASEDDYIPGPFRFGPGGERRLEALDLELLDDQHALVLREASGGLVLETIAVADPKTASWSVALADLATGSLIVDPPSRRWRVDGNTRDVTTKIVALGTIGDDRIEIVRRSLGAPEELEGYDFAAPTRGGAIVVRMSYDMTAPPSLMPFLGAVGLQHRSRLLLSRGSDEQLLAESSFELTCHPLFVALDDRPLPCLANDGIETHVWEVEPASGDRRSVGSLPGRYFAFPGPRDGTIGAWGDGRQLVVFDLPNRRVDSIDFSMPDRALGVAFAGERLGVIHHGERGASLAIYEMR